MPEPTADAREMARHAFQQLGLYGEVLEMAVQKWCEEQERRERELLYGDGSIEPLGILHVEHDDD